MGCIFSLFAKNDSEIKINYCIPSNSKFKHLRPKGTIIVGIDRDYNIPVIDTRFENFYESSVRLWPKISAHKDYFLLVNNTHTVSSYGTSDEIGYGLYDTVL